MKDSPFCKSTIWAFVIGTFLDRFITVFSVVAHMGGILQLV